MKSVMRVECQSAACFSMACLKNITNFVSIQEFSDEILKNLHFLRNRDVKICFLKNALLHKLACTAFLFLEIKYNSEHVFSLV